MDSDLRTSVKWFNTIRKTFPSLLFYVSQTYDDSILLVSLDAVGNIEIRGTSRNIDKIGSATPVTHEALSAHPLIERIDTGAFHTCDGTRWSLTDKGHLCSGGRVLVNVTADVDSLGGLRRLYYVYINTETRKIEWEERACPDVMQSLLSVIRWDRLKSALGG